MTGWNSFKRIEAVFNHEIPDRVPKFDGSIEIKELNPLFDGQASGSAILFFTPSHIALFHRFPGILSLLKRIIKHPRILQPAASIAPRIVSKLPRKFNYDMFSYTSGVPMVAHERLFRDFYTEEKNKVVRSKNGKLVWRTSPGGAHTRHGFMESPEDWYNYMEFDPEHPGNYAFLEPGLKTCKKLDIVPLISLYGGAGFEELCGMFGFERLFKLLVKNKQFVKKAVKQLNDYAVAVVEGVIQRGGKYIYFGADLGYKNRSIISPRMFQEFFKPGIKRYCRRVHNLGGKVMFHSCGYVGGLIPDLIEAGIDALHPIEKAAGNDIVNYKETYGNDLIFVGNVPVPLLTHGTPKENYEYVKYLLKNVSKDGGHIISSSHSVTQWCKLKNFLAYYKAVEDFGKYPIKIE
jgi:uroporphyrinogen decarboxylase